MAKIYYVKMYISDPYDGYDTGEMLLDDALETVGAMYKIIEIKEKGFEWEDDVPPNFYDTTVKEYDEFFDKL